MKGLAINYAEGRDVTLNLPYNNKKRIESLFRKDLSVLSGILKSYDSYLNNICGNIIPKIINSETLLEDIKDNTKNSENSYLKTTRDRYEKKDFISGTAYETLWESEKKIRDNHSASDEILLKNYAKRGLIMIFYDQNVGKNVGKIITKMSDEVEIRREKKSNFIFNILTKKPEERIQPSLLVKIKNELIQSGKDIFDFIYNDKPSNFKNIQGFNVNFEMVFSGMSKISELYESKHEASCLLENFIQDIGAIRLSSTNTSKRK